MLGESAEEAEEVAEATRRSLSTYSSRDRRDSDDEDQPISVKSGDDTADDQLLNRSYAASTSVSAVVPVPNPRASSTERAASATDIASPLRRNRASSVGGSSPKKLPSKAAPAASASASASSAEGRVSRLHTQTHMEMHVQHAC
jgi:hypothetical protein